MESWLVGSRLNFAGRKKRWIFLLGLIGISTYGVYKVYHITSVSRKTERIMKILGSLVSMAEMVSDSAEAVSLVSRDLKEFLKSDSDEIPNTLRQLSKIARSEEFSESVIRVSQAMTVGVLRGYKVGDGGIKLQEMDKLSLPDRIMDKLMSGAGTGFISVIIGSFARNLVLGFYGNDSAEGPSESGQSDMKSSSMTSSRWLDMISDDRCRVLVADSIKTFIGTAVAVYLDKTMDVNFYDEMFSGLTNPKHQNDMKSILVSLCNGMVETLVKTSHQVLTSSKSGPILGSNDSSSIIDHTEASSLKSKKGFESEASLGKVGGEMNGSIDLQKDGWMSSVSSTLAVPSNRKFLLDVTGRVTFETVRSVIEYFLWRTMEFLKRSLNVVHDEVVERGFEVVRYFGSKSSVILTLCLMLFLYIVGNTRVMLPA
ncbi:LOW QUALITY PROTEIN: protein PHLOEM PROTEIN 2-LIKE A10 [Primulina tabacum]|uniref:LOW QUALITY PROTEIN: protein PHLOEM PROTEIN 2-LIKE A10 n=1 Tax=Primulina tabacum TaxID=48773 RepID=UPI003F5A40CF